MPERYFTVADFQETKKVGKRDDGLPPLEMLGEIELDKPTEEEINTNARIIRNTLLEFDVETEVIDVKVGPTVTMYAVSPYTESVTEEGQMVQNRVRVGQIANLASDLALERAAVDTVRSEIAHCESVNDYVSREILVDILDDSEKHVDFLETQIARHDRMGAETCGRLNAEPMNEAE